jgi:cell division protein FtsL
MVGKNNKLFINKKGGEKIFSIWWFFVLAIVSIAIVSGVTIFFSSNLDIKGYEAEILSERVANCLIQNGVLKETVLEENFDIFKECQIKEELFFEKEERIFYFNLSFFDEKDKNIRKSLIQGNPSMEKTCFIFKEDKKSSENSPNQPKCFFSEESFYYYHQGEFKKGTLKIISASISQGEFL